MADPSFDVVSKVDRQEVDNALNQAAKELTTRYDFKGTGTTIAWSGELRVALQSDYEERLRAGLDVFKEKLVRRGVSLKALQHGEPQASGKVFRLTVDVTQGITDDKAKAIAKKVKQDGPKGIQAQIQGEQLRVSGKKKDDLQTVIALLRESDFGIPLQFTNYR